MKVVSPTSASEIDGPSYSSQLASGYSIAVQACWSMSAVVACMAASAGVVIENRTPPSAQAVTTLWLYNAESSSAPRARPPRRRGRR